MFYYFAYGSCMNFESLSETLSIDVRARFVGPAVVPDHALAFNYPSLNGVNFYSNLDPERGARAEGGLFQLPSSTREALRDREGCSLGRYHESALSGIECNGRRYHDVLVYLAWIVAGEGYPGERYEALMKQGLIDCQVSVGYARQVRARLDSLRGDAQQAVA